MELRQLRYFLACAEKGSLTRAAEELYTTQPHVSQVIKALEWELGVSLFRRTGSGIALTEEGERIRFYAQNALKNAALIRETARDRRGETLRIAANPSSRLAVLTEDFYCARDRELALQYTECSIEQMMELLQSRQYDLGFLFMPENRRTAFSYLAERRHLCYTALLQTDLVLHCGSASPFYGRTEVEPEELGGLPCIQLEDDFFSVEELLQEHEAFRSGRWSLDRRIRTNSDHLMLEMLGKTELCNIGSFWLRDTDPGSPFSRALIRGFQGKVSFGFLRIADRPLSPAAEAFLSRLRRELVPPGREE